MFLQIFWAWEEILRTCLLRPCNMCFLKGLWWLINNFWLKEKIESPMGRENWCLADFHKWTNWCLPKISWSVPTVPKDVSGASVLPGLKMLLCQPSQVEDVCLLSSMGSSPPKILGDEDGCLTFLLLFCFLLFCFVLIRVTSLHLLLAVKCSPKFLRGRGYLFIFIHGVFSPTHVRGWAWQVHFS